MKRSLTYKRWSVSERFPEWSTEKRKLEERKRKEKKKKRGRTHDLKWEKLRITARREKKLRKLKSKKKKEER